MFADKKPKKGSQGRDAMRKLLAIAVCAMALAIGACGDDQPASAPGQVLHRGAGPEPETLDFQKARSTQAADVQRDLGEGLVGYSATGETVPAAAESWEVSGDGLNYVFKLRKNARWSNGEPVTAEHFVFSLRRLVDPTTAAFYGQALSSIVNAAAIVSGKKPLESLGVHAADAYTLVIELDRPTPYFLALLSHPSSFPVYPPSLQEHGNSFAKPGQLVSNGAYQLVSWELGSVITVRRNPNYWNADSVSIETVMHHVTAEPLTELNRFRAGELHITANVPPEAFAALRKERPRNCGCRRILGCSITGLT